jgi:hypothetical protein
MRLFRKLIPWLIFFACLALLGTDTVFGPTTDRITVALRFSAVIFVSVLVVRAKLRPLAANRTLRCCIRLFYGESS